MKRFGSGNPVLPAEIWHIIISHVAGKPRALLALPILNKYFRNLFRFSDKLWQRIFHFLLALGRRKGVSASQTQRIVPDFALRIVDIPKCPSRDAQQIRRIISLRYLPTCSLCGGRRGHRPHWQLGLRICPSCNRRHFVSNEVLHKCMGLSKEDLLKLLAEGAYTLPSTICTVRRIEQFSDHPVDLAVGASAINDGERKRRRPLVFFWLPHVAQLTFNRLDPSMTALSTFHSSPLLNSHLVQGSLQALPRDLSNHQTSNRTAGEEPTPTFDCMCPPARMNTHSVRAGRSLPPAASRVAVALGAQGLSDTAAALPESAGWTGGAKLRRAVRSHVPKATSGQ
jgi:hypothetical protein